MFEFSQDFDTNLVHLMSTLTNKMPRVWVKRITRFVLMVIGYDRVYYCQRQKFEDGTQQYPTISE